MNKYKSFLLALILFLGMHANIVNATDQYSIIYNIPIGLSIASFSPLSDPTTLQGTVQTFDVTLNKTANITWFINGSQVQINTNITLANYTNSTAGVGIWNVSVVATDGIDIVSKTWNWTVSASTDSIPPVTNISLSGILGKNGWYLSNVTVILNATDKMSGIDYTKYNINNGSWNIYSTPFLVYAGGTNIVYYYSADKAGNIEQVKSKTININKTNLLQNPGFELSTIKSGMPDNWSKYPSTWSSTANLTYPGVGNDGSKAVGITETKTGYKQSLIQPIQTIIAGGSYQIGGYMNTTNVTGTGAVIGVDWFTTSGAYIGSNTINLVGTNPWASKMVIVIAPSNAANANFYVGLFGTGKALFDNVYLKTS